LRVRVAAEVEVTRRPKARCGRVLDGSDKVIEIDLGYSGVTRKPANSGRCRADRHFAENQSGKIRAVIVDRERGGKTVAGLFKPGTKVLVVIRSSITPGISAPACASN